MEPDLTSVHKQFPAAAEYLSNIYIVLRDYGEVSNSRLAEWSKVSAPAVSQALSRLKRLGLVRQKRYEHVTLTEAGRNLAIKVLRRHYLIEHLLVRLLEYPWDKADEEAKLLQTQISDSLADHLHRRLGSPQACPHGNPMPGSAIEPKLLNAPKLTEAVDGHLVRILRITEEGEQLPTMLSFCYRNGIRPGARFRVKRLTAGDVDLTAVSDSVEGQGRESIVVPADKAKHIRYEDV